MKIKPVYYYSAYLYGVKAIILSYSEISTQIITTVTTGPLGMTVDDP
jgi:hypothetical protein